MQKIVLLDDVDHCAEPTVKLGEKQCNKMPLICDTSDSNDQQRLITFEPNLERKAVW